MATDVLIVEDESIVALDLENRLRSMGFSVVGRAGTGAAAIELVGRTPPDVVLMDIQLRGDIDGIKTADLIQEEYDVPVIFLTAFSDSKSLERAKRSNAYGYLLKPFQERELSIAIELALYKHGAERELRENRALLRVTLHNVTEGIVTADRADRILFMNRAAEQLTGWSASEAVGIDIGSVVKTDIPILETLSSEEWTRLTPRAGTPRTVAVSSNDLQLPSGAGGSRVVVIRDVTQEEEYRANLVAAKEAAESAAQAKSDFLARVTHELRTPLNSILGMTRLLHDEPDPRSTQEYLEILDLSAQQLMALISDILDYARFDSGRFSLQRELFDPVVVLERVSRSFAVEAGKKGLRVTTVIDPVLPRAVYGDQTRLGQILRNMISNAVKFTEAGHIVVTARATGGSRVTIEVEDTGPGVSSEYRSLIFEDFSQIESPATRKAGGVGLGLALVRRLVDAMEGSVDLKQSSSQGSVFAVELPFAPAEDPAPADRSITAGIRSVATDDQLIARSWEPWCVAAGVAFSHLSWQDIVAAPAQFDRIITTDGHARELPDSGAVLVVGGIHRTQSAQVSRERSVFSLLEPVPVEVIRETLSGADVIATQRQGTGDAERPASKPPAPDPALRLLIVDDDRNNLVLHRKLLESRGHRVVAASGGSEALVALQQDTFDVAILDIEMPEMDGWELARHIRAGEAGDVGSSLRMVALSGHAVQEIEERAWEAGFDTVMSKPVPIDTMHRVVCSLGGNHNRQSRDDSQIAELQEAVASGDYSRAQELLAEMKQRSPQFTQSAVAETAFRLLLALRRKDTDAIHRLVAELEKETDR